jgi:hypothetical protein
MNTTENKLTNHDNLTNEIKIVLGKVVAEEKNIAREIFNFEHSKYKNYVGLAHIISNCDNRKQKYLEEARNMEIPIENIELFNKGIYTGLINPNRITYVAYWD